MSKVIKQMQMDALKGNLGQVRDMVFLSVKGLSAQAEHNLRMALRKKKVSLHVVKNSLTRLVFRDLGIKVGDDSAYWTGPTALAFGTDSLGELSRSIEGELKSPKLAPVYKDKVTIKGALADGQPVGFDIAVKMPTRAEAIGQVLAAILGGGGAIAGCLAGPGGQVAGQIETISKKTEEAPAATSA